MLMWLPPSSELEVTTCRNEAAYCDGRAALQSYPQYPQAIEKLSKPQLLDVVLSDAAKDLFLVAN